MRTKRKREDDEAWEDEYTAWWEGYGGSDSYGWWYTSYKFDQDSIIDTVEKLLTNKDEVTSGAT